MRREPAPPSRTARAVAVARAIGTPELHDPVVAELLPFRDRAVIDRLRPVVADGGRRAAAVHAASGGLTVHAALRMAAIDTAVTVAVASARQVVVVGAGFDTRAWRMPALRGARVTEIDLPAVQHTKRARLSLPPLASEVRFAAADLAANDLGEVLQCAGHDPTAPTLWLWEAVAPYLATSSVEATIAVLGARSAPGSTVAMTYTDLDEIAPQPAQLLVRPVVRAGFALIGEPLLSSFGDEQIGARLRAAGFTDVTTSRPSDWALAAGIDACRSAFAAEHLAVARRL